MFDKSPRKCALTKSARIPSYRAGNRVLKFYSRVTVNTARTVENAKRFFSFPVEPRRVIV